MDNTDSRPHTADGSQSLLLVCDKTYYEGLKCVIYSIVLDVPIDVSKEISLCSSITSRMSPSTVASVLTERPFLLTPDGPIFSSYAICRYLADVSSNRKSQHPAFDPSHQTSLTRSLQIEESLDHTIRVVEPALSGSKKRVYDILAEIDLLAGRQISSNAVNRSSIVEGVDKLCIGDIFLVAALIKRKGCITKQRHPHLHSYFNSCLETYPFREALLRLPMAQPPSPPPTPLDVRSRKFYITTAINYTNGLPHIGHAYEAVLTDIISRYHRIFGRDVLFITGTDEHGQKIEQAAHKKGVTPQELADVCVNAFKSLNIKMDISNDFFVRTSTAQHKEVCQWLWAKVAAKGDIYLGTYVGWYNVREESFVTEREAQENCYKDPTTGVPYTKMEEASYFFDSGKYQTALLKHIQEHENFIQPSSRRNEILARLREPLEPLSLSRATCQWGISVPDDDKHVMYVWFDALTSYISILGYPNGEEAIRYWPADVHVIGKDIIWFHAVIWSCMLLSADIPLPKCVFAHGHVHAADGRKISKSFGTVVDPEDILKEHSSDTFRFYIAKETTFGGDLKYDVDGLIEAHNSELADILGNLVNRAIGLCSKFANGMVPDTDIPAGSPPFDMERLVSDTDNLYRRFAVQDAVEAVMNACRDTNKYLTIHAPWGTTKTVKERLQVVRATLEATYIIGHFLEPIMPKTAEKIFSGLMAPPKKICELSNWFDNLTPGNPVDVSLPILFAKIDSIRQTKKNPKI